MRLFCVTGMHRSGTSLTARMLGLLGVELGPEDSLMRAQEANPKGYWELQALADLDEELLGYLGGNWHRLPHLASGWENDAELDEFRERARKILDDAFAGAATAAVKDPRLSVLLPFLRTVTTVDRTVVVVRQPDEVVRSLQRRDGFDTEKCAGLWIDHLVAALTNANGRVLAFYDDLLHDSGGEAERLAKALGIDAPDEEALEAITYFADPALRRATGPDIEDAGPELQAARALWEALDHASDAEVLADVLLAELARTRNARRGVQYELAEQQRDEASRARDALRARDEAERELQRLRSRVDEVERAARARNHELQTAQRAAERWREEHERLRSRRAVRLALGVAQQFRPVFETARSLRVTEDQFRGGREAGESNQPRRAGPASVEEADALVARLRESAPGSDRVAGPLVSICVLTRDGEHHLRRLLPALADTAYRDFELVVVDNGSTNGSLELLRGAELGVPVHVVQNTENVSFSEGNNQAAEAASGEYLLLLNNDIEPLCDGWLGRLVDTLEDREAAAVGARLVYPRRPDLEGNQGDVLYPDLTLQHRGVHFDAGVDGVPRGRNLGAGEDPMSAAAAAVTELPAVTAACMLLRREAYDAVGGLTPGYRYGTEDVDLCLKLRAHGGRIVYDGQAVLWHHEYGTQNEQGREIKRRNRMHNRELFVDRWGPQLYRQVLLDKLADASEWSADPLHVAITVTKDDPDAGYGDYYTAHELGEALTALGYLVSYVERHGDRWYDLDASVDVVVALLDAFDLRRVPPTVVSVAWVRNWTQRWVGRPWFQDYDLVLASSVRTKEVVEAQTAKRAHVFPLATNPERFAPDGPSGEACLGVFAGNYWDKPRDVIPALQALPDGLDVRVHGSNWEEVDGVARLARGPLPYEELPALYRGAAAVIDDTAEHTAPYHAVNSRVFDALATGASVITDNPIGVAEVLGEDLAQDVLTWHDASSLQEQLRWVDEHPEEARERAQRLRAAVLRDHTYVRRAEQLRDLLVEHVRAVRWTIAIGVPREEERHRWGDEHFARDVQRQLERRGHPTRVLILPEWGEAHAGRDDVVLHLFGLSQLQTRPSQTNVLWNISHPELVTPAMVDRYDVAFTVGGRFAEELSGQALTPVHHLPQATDPARFRPDGGDAPRHDLLFVGNSRKVRRQIVDDTVAVLDRLPDGAELAIYGADWTPDLVDQRYVVADHVDNRRLGAYYAAATIVLNDHWADMRAKGFVSNRLFDALAAGAFVVSDHLDAIEELFDGTVATYTDREELARVLADHLADPGARRARAELGREIVTANHTFGHRVERMLDVLDGHWAEAGRRDLVVA